MLAIAVALLFAAAAVVALPVIGHGVVRGWGLGRLYGQELAAIEAPARFCPRDFAALDRMTHEDCVEGWTWAAADAVLAARRPARRLVSPAASSRPAARAAGFPAPTAQRAAA